MPGLGASRVCTADKRKADRSAGRKLGEGPRARRQVVAVSSFSPIGPEQLRKHLNTADLHRSPALVSRRACRRRRTQSRSARIGRLSGPPGARSAQRRCRRSRLPRNTRISTRSVKYAPPQKSRSRVLCRNVALSADFGAWPVMPARFKRVGCWPRRPGSEWSRSRQCARQLCALRGLHGAHR